MKTQREARSEGRIRKRTIGALVLLGLISCGTDPAHETDVASDATDGLDLAPEAVAADVADGGHTTTECDGAPGFDCVQDCATDVSFPGVCIDGDWACPAEMPIRFDDCDHGCPGEPAAACCDAIGAEVAPAECILGAWSCAGGSSPDFCCPVAPQVCVVECSSEPTSMVCERGELYCAEPTFERTECGCAGDEPLCCEASGALTETLCTESGWACASAASPEFCQSGPSSIDGTWSERARLDCDGSESISADPIAEFMLSDAGFELTYASGMFETFKNYWGGYSYDPSTGFASFEIDGGNSNPTRGVLEGRIVELPDGQTEWLGFWFGTNDDDSVPQGHCGYRMQR